MGLVRQIFHFVQDDNALGGHSEQSEELADFLSGTERHCQTS